MAVDQWLAGAHGDLPEIQLQIAGGQGVLDQIVLAHAGAARGDEHVRTGGRVGGLCDGLAVVRRDGQDDGIAAAGAHQGGEGVGVGGDDAARRDGLAGQGDFVAGGEQHDARPAVHAHPRVVGGGDEADVTGVEAAAGGNKHVPDGEILAGAADVAAGYDSLVHPHLVAVGGGVFLQQDGVRTVRHQAAREQP